jgi:hypothetical protein
MGKNLVRVWEMRNAYKNVFVKPERKKLGRPGRRWKSNIIFHTIQIWCEDGFWSHMVQEMDLGQLNMIQLLCNGSAVGS